MTHDTRRFVLEALTPVHVGSGVRLPSSEVVHDRQENRSYVLDLEAALEALGPDAFKGERIPNAEALLRLLRRRGVPAEAVCWSWAAGRFAACDLRLCVRDGVGRPMIPGSSIKGALRTAVLVGLGWDFDAGRRNAAGAAAVAETMRKLPENRPEFAARRLEKMLLRPDLAGGGRDQLDPHDDPLRVLSVTDAAFDARSVSVEHALVNSPAGHREDALKEYKIGVEALAPGSRAELTIRLDRFLGQEHARRLGFDSASISWESLSAWSRRQALRLARADLEVYRARGLEGPARALEGVARRLEQAGEGSLCLRLGWGIGWAGTTGALASSSDRARLIREYGSKLSRHSPDAYSDARPFPKSRKVAGRDTPDGVFGWVVLRPAGAGERLPRPEPPPVHHAAPKAEPTASSAQPAPPQSPGDRIALELAALKPHELASRITDIHTRATKGCTDPVDLRRVLVAIKSKMKEAGLLKEKKWKEKPWVKALIDLPS